MQLKMFVAPIKNLGDAEAEMNGFLRGHRERIELAERLPHFDFAQYMTNAKFVVYK